MRLSPLVALGFPAALLSAPASAEALSFETATYPACGGCSVVFASGEIDVDAGERLLATAVRRGLGRGTILVLDSPGGRLLGGLRLGQAIRQLGFDTRVGRLDGDGRPIDGSCASACGARSRGRSPSPPPSSSSYGL